MSKDYDVLVIGGGPAGYIAAIRASQLGARTAIVERAEIGGTCLNRGCIPTKSYLRTAEALMESREWQARGILLDSPPRFDMTIALACKNATVRKLTTGVRAILESRKADILAGSAVLIGPGIAEIGGVGRVRSRSIILAGGSVSSRLPIPGADSPKVLLSEDLLALDRVPSSLVIIGGGAIGVEAAQYLSAFGCEVSIVELEGRILPTMDEDLSKLMHVSLAKRGVAIHAGAGISAIEDKKGGLSVLLSDGRRIEASLALLSIGRLPDLSCLGASGVAVERGRVAVNMRMETSVSGVFAPGDINGKRMLAHAAFAMGEAAAENAMGGSREADLRVVPSVVYGKPEIASVGLTEAEARAAFDRVEVGVFPFSANGRALASGDTEGFVKVVIEPGYGEILGVHIAGAGASELINEASAAMRMEATAHELIEVVHAHPTRSEALMEAAAAALGRCIHLPARG
jgi:dihydrolipoamide dehydrogenase